MHKKIIWIIALAFSGLFIANSASAATVYVTAGGLNQSNAAWHAELAWKGQYPNGTYHGISSCQPSGSVWMCTAYGDDNQTPDPVYVTAGGLGQANAAMNAEYAWKAQYPSGTYWGISSCQPSGSVWMCTAWGSPN